MQAIEEDLTAPEWAVALGAWAQFQSKADSLLEGDLRTLMLQFYDTRSKLNSDCERIIYWMVKGIGGNDLNVYTTWRGVPRGDKSPDAKELQRLNENLMRRMRRYVAKLANSMFGEPELLPSPPKKPQSTEKPQPVEASTEKALEIRSASPESAIIDVRRPNLNDEFNMASTNGDSDSDSDCDEPDEPDQTEKITLRVIVDKVEFEEMLLLLTERGFVMNGTDAVFIKQEPEY